MSKEQFHNIINEFYDVILKTAVPLAAGLLYKIGMMIHNKTFTYKAMWAGIITGISASIMLGPIITYYFSEVVAYTFLSVIVMLSEKVGSYLAERWKLDVFLDYILRFKKNEK